MAVMEGPVAKLFHWRDVKVTAPVFIAGNLFFLAILYWKMTLLRTFSLVLLWYCGVAFAAKNILEKVAPQYVPKPSLTKDYISRELAMSKVDPWVKKVNALIDEAKNLAFCVDNKKTFQFIGIFFGLMIVGRMFSDMVILYVLFLACFIWPVVYEKYQPQIDEQVDKAKVMANDHATKLNLIAKEKMDMGKKYIAENPTMKTLADKFTPKKTQ
uniref:Reticulon-like protein n=1 Tax=Compsopogon caeruleus TaxID=31354 RepID=A0A7S1TEX6_9RHOD|mmetsp:Transcript_4006/g.7725  ORF Transcript_4006/g.7725 Transcript_4006/m.7725 type:complete len:213 (+) Transcript_4006:187-825(+)|eukprot:CAMPEP_0184684220 /NCGR_PEP_ID=MMETSP0312-20130426/14341_1 /TAXON_ID=31354 /ORGANISM="Compsopogon coeruleus, Strain SAG 36.94" /LENGTH=212 /DNA_ID=CAMNT_0027137189 /DNA_START=161 /DNA_END=799 /DNA_ORIENTATION=+